MGVLLWALANACVALQLLLCASLGVEDEAVTVATGSLCWLQDDYSSICEKYVRGWLLLWFGVAERSEWGIGQLDRILGMMFSSDMPMPLSEPGNCSLLGPAASTVALLRAMRSDGSRVAAARAYLVFRAVDAGGLGTLVAHLEQDWPVFAFLDMLVERLELGAARASAAVATSAPAAVAGGEVAGPDALEPCAAGAWTECVLACVVAVARLPGPQSLRHLGRRRHGPAIDALAALRGALLQRAAAAINRLGTRGLVELGRRGAWLALHRLHVQLRLQAACPEGSVLYRTEEVEPAYDVCLPRSKEWGIWTIKDWKHREEVAALDVPDDQHYTYMVLEQGRWRDCDELGPLAESVGLQPFADSLAVDVGSNLGSCTCYLLALGFKVHAIDAEAKANSYLQGAAWREEAEGRLVVHHAMVGRGLGNLWLDELLEHERAPMLVKIDIEGEELEALRGARRALASGRVRAVLLELHCEMLERRGEDPYEAVELFTGAGFNVSVQTLNCWVATTPGRKDVFSREMAITSRSDLDVQRRKLLPLEGPNLQVVARLPRSLAAA